jgi:hypothetical protein
MADLDKHLNLLYSGTTPLNLGDRYYAQDLIRDLNYSWDLTGQTVKRVLGTFPALLYGGVVTMGAGDTLNITEAFGICSFDVEVPDTFASLPPSKMTVTIARKVHATAQTNLAMASATKDGVTPNYIKLAYAETNGNTRTRARAAGSYSYERVPSYTYSITAAAPTAYEVSLGTVIIAAGGAGPWTLSLATPYNLKKAYDDLDVIEKKHGVSNSAVAVAAYTIGDSDQTNDIFADPSALAFAVNLPTLAANIGRIIRTKVISAGGAVSLTPEGAELLEGVNAAFVMQSIGDHCTVIGETSGWRILSAYAKMDTGWINTADWTTRSIGNQKVTVVDGAAYVVGELVTEATSSNTGIILAKATHVLTLKNVTGTGVFTNGRVLTGSTSGANSTVNGSTKNQDTNITHNLLDFNKLKFTCLFNSTATETACWSMSLFGLVRADGAHYGLQLYQVSSSAANVYTGQQGVMFLLTNSTGDVLDSEDYYYRFLVERVI